MNKRTQWSVLSIATGLAAATLTGCGTEDGDSGSGASVVVGMSDDVQTTDPASGYDPGSWLLFNNVYQSLLSFPVGSTEPEPEAARKCGFTDTRTQVFTCTLRDGLKFSNGNELTSADVKFSFDRTLRINDDAGPAIMFPMLEKVETPDERTVVFHLNVPDATFPSKIASGAGSIVDRREYPADKLRTDGKAVGSGPYKLDSFSKERAEFSRSGSYKGPAEIKNSRVVLRLFDGDQPALKKALLAGAVDVAYRGLEAQDIAEIERDTSTGSGIDIVPGTSAEVQHLVLNMKHPVTRKDGVRKAMAYLIDREALVQQVYDSTAAPLYSIIPAGITAHNTAFFDEYGSRPEPEKAKKALRDEGITEKVDITLWSTPSRYGPSTDKEFRAIAEQLNASGLFDAKVRSVEFAEYEKGIAAGEYGVYVKGWVPDYPDPDNFTQPFFGKGNVLENEYVNRVITEEIIPATAAENDRSATSGDYAKLQNAVARDVPIIPLWQAKQYAVVRDRVYGLEKCLDASTVFRFWEISKG
ncbi:ABC transporter substrate-binding protein [Streptomyces uncialis]|uniref:ABC transporter substrate-binding protein n=1 Tax=Streptomyces uncialis TaxID=1048205 RepID=UPI002258722B|nr:ABC transporter substrate-binding protein [Streptomyces uncialis]MCX4662845.1 ABC transporter substrate-binding protein [Streptomyces uncialis]